MGYPIDGDDDFLIKLLFRLFGKPFLLYSRGAPVI